MRNAGLQLLVVRRKVFLPVGWHVGLACLTQLDLGLAVLLRSLIAVDAQELFDGNDLLGRGRGEGTSVRGLGTTECGHMVTHSEACARCIS